MSCLLGEKGTSKYPLFKRQERQYTDLCFLVHEYLGILARNAPLSYEIRKVINYDSISHNQKRMKRRVAMLQKRSEGNVYRHSIYRQCIFSRVFRCVAIPYAWYEFALHMAHKISTVHFCCGVNSISDWHGDAGDATASPMLKNWPLFRQKFSKFGQSLQLHSHVSEVLSIFKTKEK